jgi:hypothetical protein
MASSIMGVKRREQHGSVLSCLKQLPVRQQACMHAAAAICTCMPGAVLARPTYLLQSIYKPAPCWAESLH